MVIDLRSDTVTLPTSGMREAMMNARLGDDVFGEDPEVNALEKECAELLGMEAAVFCPSGTMTNQIGIRILTQPYDEVICYKGAHIYRYEGGGIAGNSLASVRLLEGNRGRLTADEIAVNINNAQDPHQPITSLVALENTVVREAGSYYRLEEIAVISSFARSKGLKMHLDGARLFHALTETGDAAGDYGNYFDTISICLSKGLGAPVGSVLLCSKALEPKARRMRKALGGGMRQAGFLAAAGRYALKHHIKRLKEDHQRARILGDTLGKASWVQSIMPVDTNIVIFTLNDSVSPQQFLQKLAEFDIKALAFGPQQIRMVTHLDFDDAKLERTVQVVKKMIL
ncbi:MAG: aminotransferase class I/II-fold pyridoxal phosphate-dependent enzyme [Cyclobacteriaceae bacterium]|jgi:threonine aldolase|nr:aminotransferase class I/II-fold pyridoxal phosphate-dependent enzyme [Cyclobacteriaceae bacterium]